MAAIGWTDVLGIAAELEVVGAAARAVILAEVNSTLNVSLFGGENAPKLRLARLYLAAHCGTMIAARTSDDIVSETIAATSLSTSYASLTTDEALQQTWYGTEYLRIKKTTPSRLPFTIRKC